MATNKVVYGNETLIDLTNDTATEADVVSGKTFHKKNGVAATGTAELKKSPKITQIIYQEYTSQSTARTYTFTASEDMYIVGYGYANCDPKNSSTRSIVDITTTSRDLFIEPNNNNNGKPSSSEGNSDAMVHVRGFIASGQTITFNITAYGTDAKGIIELFRFENVSKIDGLEDFVPNESQSTQTFTFTAPCDMYIVGIATANSKKTISSARHSIGITPSVNTVTVTQHLTEKTSSTVSADWGVIKTFIGFLPKGATISYSYLCYYYGCGCIAIYGFDGVYDPPENTEYNDMGVDNNYRYVDTSGLYAPLTIIPSDTSPPSMSLGSVYKPKSNGYAIESYTSVTPSASGAYFPSGMVKMSASGYAFSSQKLNKFGRAPDAYKIAKLNSGSSTTLAVTQKPKFINYVIFSSIDTCVMVTVDVSANVAYAISYYSSADHTGDYTSTWKNYITTISDTSVVFKNTASAQRRVLLACYYE